MVRWWQYVLGVSVAVAVVGVPITYYRAAYVDAKRFREVTPGRFYRCGQMTQRGFEAAFRRHGIRTVINLQNEAPDPPVKRSLFDRTSEPESEFCRRHGVRYVLLEPDLVPPNEVPHRRPKVLDDYLALLDDPANYPVLIHCKAGLHRTGLLTAVYRMEYEGWSKPAAVIELKANGFGEFACSSANDYVTQYLLTYQPRAKPAARATSENHRSRSSPDDSTSLSGFGHRISD